MEKKKGHFKNLSLKQEEPDKEETYITADLPVKTKYHQSEGKVLLYPSPKKGTNQHA